MNLPTYECNENIKGDLLMFLKTAQDCRTNKYCNKDEYKRLTSLFPLSTEIKQDLKSYSEKANVCIDITQSDDDQPKVQNKTAIFEDADNIQDCNVTACNDLVETIKDSLKIEKAVSKTLVEQLLSIDSKENLCSLAGEFTTEDLHIIWGALDGTDEVMIENYIRFFILPKARQEFVYEIQEIILEICQNYWTILKSELVKEFLQGHRVDDETAPDVLIQYVNLLSENYKTEILRDFISTMEKLHSNYIPVIDNLLNTHVDPNILSKLVELMAAVTMEYCNNNAYGKLLYKGLSSLDRRQPGLEQPLKSILGTHRSIWKLKVEKIVANWFNDSLTQSFM